MDGTKLNLSLTEHLLWARYAISTQRLLSQSYTWAKSEKKQVAGLEANLSARTPKAPPCYQATVALNDMKRNPHSESFMELSGKLALFLKQQHKRISQVLIPGHLLN